MRRASIKWLSFSIALIVVAIPLGFAAYLYFVGYPSGQVSAAKIDELSKLIGETWETTSKDDPAALDALVTNIKELEDAKLRNVELSDVKASLAAVRAAQAQRSLDHSAKWALVANKLDEIARQAAQPATKPEAAAVVARLEPLVNSLFPWPMTFVLAVVIAILLLTARSGPGVALLARIETLSLGQVFSLTLKDQQDKAAAESALAGFRRLVISGHEEAMSKAEVDLAFGKVVKKLEPWLAMHVATAANLIDARFTLHVPSPFFEAYLYQLVDYHGYGRSLDTDTRGRLFSYRFGLIGRAWRTGSSDTQGSIPKGEDKLIEGWGMTRAEAREKKGRESMSATVICTGVKPIAIFYMDAQQPNAFALKHGVTPALDEEVKRLAEQEGLVAALRKMESELRATSIPTFRLDR